MAGYTYVCCLQCIHIEFILTSIVSSAVMTDLSGGVTYPAIGSNSVFSYSIHTNAEGESTQMGAFWWDGGQSIYKYAFDIHLFDSEFMLWR